MVPAAAELPNQDAAIGQASVTETPQKLVKDERSKDALEADSRQEARRVEGLVIFQRSHGVRTVEGREERGRMTVSAALQTTKGKLTACTDRRAVPVDDATSDAVDNLEVLRPVTCEDRAG